MALTPQGLVAVGLDDDAFGAWTLVDGSWRPALTFGRRDPAGTEAAYVVGLASVGSEVAVTYSDGAQLPSRARTRSRTLVRRDAARRRCR